MSFGKMVLVRVITIHPEDDEFKRVQATVLLMEQFCSAQEFALKGVPVYLDPKQEARVPEKCLLSDDEIDKQIATITRLRVKANDHRRELLRQILSVKQTGEEIEEIIASCTTEDVELIFLAATNPNALQRILDSLSKTPPAGGQTQTDPQKGSSS